MAGKILVIDDERHLRMLYQEELQGEGYTVALSDGQEDVLDLISREKPDVLVLDIRIEPNISGLDLLQTLRGPYPSLPVILSTAYDSFQHDLKSIAADFYVVKSVDLTELKAKVKEAMIKKTSAAPAA
ncbi:MAG: response regulator [Deltaproteobacteria bacterium]|jgi:DNA-binding NtrC family response regulator|nr:response regulator [Deltaproteobacteria bacterium]